MSKSKKNKKRNKVNHTDNKNKFNRKKAITVTVVLLVIVVAVVALIFTMHNKANDIVGTDWVSSSAVNASGDEVEMAEVYNTSYTSYQGSLSFKDDGTFSLWLTPGTSEDGTHSGKYTVNGDTITAAFDDGETTTSFYIHRNGDKIESISLNYEDYEVYFTLNIWFFVNSWGNPKNEIKIFNKRQKIKLSLVFLIDRQTYVKYDCENA